jgi:hypothetical protein
MKYPPRSPEYRRKMALASTGRHHSPETRAKISAAKKGQRPWLGRKHSMATRQKLREATLRYVRQNPLRYIMRLKNPAPYLPSANITNS